MMVCEWEMNEKNVEFFILFLLTFEKSYEKKSNNKKAVVKKKQKDSIHKTEIDKHKT